MRVRVVLALALGLGLACSGGGSSSAPVGGGPVASPAPDPRPTPPRAKGRTGKRKARTGKSKSPARSRDAIEWVSQELGREPCDRNRSTCGLLSKVSRAVRPSDGSYLGIAVPCIEADGDRSAELTQLLKGNLANTDISGLRFHGGAVQVFAMNASNDAEQRMLDDVRDQFSACLKTQDCQLRVDPSILDEIADPDGEAVPYHRDEQDHLVAKSSDLVWELGTTLAGPGWWIVNEHREHEVACNWLDIVVAVTPTK